MFQSGDSIMADREIMVQDKFANQDVLVNTPTMLSGRSQLEPNELVKDRRVASKRIHIERIIGLAKSYKILKKEMCQSRVQLGARIIYICFALANFRNSIVHKYAWAIEGQQFCFPVTFIIPLCTQQRNILDIQRCTFDLDLDHSNDVQHLEQFYDFLL